MNRLKTDRNSDNHNLRTNYSCSHRITSGGTESRENVEDHDSYQAVSNSNITENALDITSTFDRAILAGSTSSPFSTKSEVEKTTAKTSSADEKPQQSSKKESKLILDEMEERILKKLTIIQYDDCLYYYDGYCYQIIRNQKELVKLIRSKVSRNAFASSTLRCFPDLYTYIQTNEALISSDCMRKNTYYVSFQNGILNLRNMKLYPHSSKYLIFYSLDANWIPHPTTRYFQQFLQSVSGGDSQISLLVPIWCPIGALFYNFRR